MAGASQQDAAGTHALDSALVLAGDEAFALGLAVALYSALEHLPPELRPWICVLDNGLSESSVARLRKMVGRLGRGDQLQFFEPPSERLEDLPRHSRFTPATYSRLLIPELLPATVRRVVYLDADVLVRRDMSALFELELGEAVIAAAPDLFIGDVSHLLTDTSDRMAADAALRRRYFNSGVLLIDVPRWRAAGLTDAVVRYALSRQEMLPFVDQDALNVVIDRYHELERVWNVQPLNLDLARRRIITDQDGYRQDRELYRHARVLHFIGPKPWDHRCETRGAVPWARTLLRSRWYGRREAARWLAAWLGRRAARRPRVARERWIARLGALRRSLR